MRLQDQERASHQQEAGGSAREETQHSNLPRTRRFGTGARSILERCLSTTTAAIGHQSDAVAWSERVLVFLPVQTVSLAGNRGSRAQPASKAIEAAVESGSGRARARTCTLAQGASA